MEPIALLAGRRAGAPLVPEGCTTGVLARSASRTESRNFGFDNITRDMGCPAWIAIFSKEFAMLHVRLAEAPYRPFSTVADQDSRKPAPFSRVDIPVEVYHAGSLPARLTSDTLEALSVFGALNYAGIRLVFTIKSGVACPTTPASTPTIFVCYSTTSQPSSLPSGIIELPVTTGPSYELSHQVGRALGLDAIDGAAPEFPRNVMSALATSRGSALTLGQVFRIHAHLGCAPDACEPDALPPLTASATP
jgi:hypothetical protein